MASNRLLKSLTYAGIILSVSSSFMGVTTLAVNAQDDSGVTKAGKGIPTKVDDSELKAAIAEAKKLGLTVDEKTKELVVDAKDTASESDKIKADYSTQTKAIKDAVATYKAAKEKYDADKAQYDKDYAQYQKDLDEYNKKHNADGNSISSNDVIQNLTVGEETGAKLALSNISSNTTSNVGVKNWSDFLATESGSHFQQVHDVQGSTSKQAALIGLKSGEKDATMTATYTDLSKSWYTDSSGKKHKISKIVRKWTNIDSKAGIEQSLRALSKYSDDDVLPNGLKIKDVKAMRAAGMTWLVLTNNPTHGGNMFDLTNASATDQYFDENGKVISVEKGTAWGTAASLNNWMQKDANTNIVTLDGAVAHREKVKGGNAGTVGKSFVGSSVSLNNGGWLYANKTNDDSDNAEQANTTWDLSKGKWDNPTSKYQYYGAGVFQLSGDTFKYDFGLDRSTGDTNPWYWGSISTIIPKTEIQPPVKPVAPKAPTKPKLKANFTNLLSMPDVNKDVEAGTQAGNPDGSADKQVFMKGDKMTYALSSSALPAGREKLKTLGFSDELPKGFKYDSFKAFDKSGKDITDQIKDVKVEDGKITGSFTGFNDDLTKEYNVPTIDLYGTASEDNVTLKNKYELLVDGDPYESNEVENPVVDPKPKKLDLDEHGNDIDGKEVKPGSTITYAIDADLTPFANTTISKENLDKGFSVTDDYDESKLDVTDETKKNLSVEIADAKDNEETKPSDDNGTSSTEDENTDSSSSSTSENSNTDKKATSTSESSTQDSTSKDDTTSDDGSLTVGEGSADKFDMNDVKVAWDDKMGKLVVSARDTREFFKKYAGKTLEIRFSPKVKEDATGTLTNTAIQDTFGNNKNTNTVSNDVTPDAKPVEKELSHTGVNNLFGQISKSIEKIFGAK